MNLLLFLALLHTDVHTRASVCAGVCFKPHKPSSPAVCHSSNLLCCLSPDCRYCHANQGATRRKGEQNRMDRSFLYLALHAALSAPPSLPSSPPPILPPSSYLPRHLPPSLILSFRPFMCSVIAATIGSFWKTLNYRAAASSAHIHAAETQQQIKAGRNLSSSARRNYDYSQMQGGEKREKAALLFSAREFKMSTFFFQYVCGSGDLWGCGGVGVEWARGSRTGK